jgi:16S rRNA processing protein RimM
MWRSTSSSWIERQRFRDRAVSDRFVSDVGGDGVSDNRIQIGTVARPHGLNGELMVVLSTDRTDERCQVGQRWWAGDRVLVLTAVRAHQHRWLVSFDGVMTREAAEALAGAALSAERIDDPDALWVDDLVGTMVIDAGGVDRGRVVAVQANPAHPMLELDSGALVPSVFVLSCADGVTRVETPEGLFELF